MSHTVLIFLTYVLKGLKCINAMFTKSANIGEYVCNTYLKHLIFLNRVADLTISSSSIIKVSVVAAPQ